MRTFRLIIGICIFISAGIQPVLSQTRKEREQKTGQEVKAAIDAGRYMIIVDYASPLNGKPVSLTTGYSLEVRNDSVFSHLPYFGRAYNIPYGGGKGLMFKEALYGYKAEYHKKGKAKIKFTVKGNEDTYNFFIIIFPNRKATVNVNSINRQSISFDGTMKLPAAGE